MFNLFTSHHCIARSSSKSDYYSICCGIITTFFSITIFFILLFTLNILKAFFITGAFILLCLLVSCFSLMLCQTEEPVGDSHLAPEQAHNNPPNNYILGSKIPVLTYEGSVSLSCRHCLICLEAIKGGEKVKELPVCEHLFHAECIDMWLYSHMTCPLCRCNIQPSVKPTSESATASELPV